MNRRARLGATVLIADHRGDYPAIITRVLGAATANMTALPDGQYPLLLQGVIIHRDREHALMAKIQHGRHSAYWSE